MEVICFHNPDEENGYMSNWFLSDFTIDGVKFTSMEQYMMYSKAVCFNDKVIAEQILNTQDVAHIKELGRSVLDYNENIWNGMRQIIIYEGLLAKFTQNDSIREQLKSTGNAILAECAVHDCIWGIGLAMDNPKRLDISQWRGQNLLGYALIMVRNRI